MFDIRSLFDDSKRELTEQEQKDRMVLGSAIANNPVFTEVMQDVCVESLQEVLQALRVRDFEKAYSHLMMIDATKDVERLFASMKEEVEGGAFNSNGTLEQNADVPNV